MKRHAVSAEQVAALVRRSLAEGRLVEIDGLGTLTQSGEGQLLFLPQTGPKVFIAYAEEDAAQALRLYDDLAGAGCRPWLDRRKLLPGQNWPRSIEREVETSDFFIACFSRRSVRKPGGFQCELRYAMDCAARLPLDDIFLIPVRLDACRVPHRIQREVQYVDLFPNWDRGIARILAAIRSAPRRSTALP